MVFTQFSKLLKHLIPAGAIPAYRFTGLTSVISIQLSVRPASEAGERRTMTAQLPFPRVKLKGSPEEIGWQCGRLLDEPIKATVSFYREFIADQFRKIPGVGAPKSDDDIFSQIDSITRQYAELIRSVTPEYAEEIEALASAVKLPVEDIYMINCRSELVCQAISLQTPPKKDPPEHECTAVLVPQKRLMAQTWDWHPRMEELLTVIEIQPKSGDRFTMLAEPGIIGKFGINDRGLGVMLTILFAPVSAIGVPVHLLLRRILESDSTSSAYKAIKALPLGSTASLTFCDRSGDWRMIEILDKQIINIEDDGSGLIHSNHYLSEKDAKESALPASHGRVKRAKELYQPAADSGVSGMMRLLSDREGGAESICRNYGMGKLFEVGTVAALILDLPEQTMYVARGQPAAEEDWHPVRFD